MLQIERHHGASPEVWPVKAAEVQRTLGLSADAYRLLLVSLLEDPVALAEAPDVIEPLRRLRESRLS